MHFKKFWKVPRHILHLQRQEQFLDGFNSIEAFRKLLDRERALADRHNHEFSLVVFAMEQPKTDLGSLVPTITHRVRSGDELGWISDSHLGVVLPYTSFSGAEKLAKDICQLMQRPLTYAVYTYPAQWFSNEYIYSQRRSVETISPAQGSSNGHNPRSTSTPISAHSALHSERSMVSLMQISSTDKEDIKGLFSQQIPAWKRGIDLVGALVGILLFSPILLLIAIFIKAVSPGPVLFKQERVGYLGKPFTIWKFRTMYVNANSSVHQQYLSLLISGDKPMTKLDVGRDPRIIPCGKILRLSGLDELPQLINVLRGDMSLVGPRPCLPYEANGYQLWQLRRFDVLPGLTGLWQVSGKNRTTFKEMMRLDISYAKVKSFWLDIQILLKTVPAIVIEASHSRLKLQPSDRENSL